MGLVLSRKVYEQVVIDDLTITVIEIKGHRVKLKFDAPEEIVIRRKELHDAAHEKSRN